MSIVLPTKKVKAEQVNPKRLIIYSKPKAGKTTAFSMLDDNLILDLEGGSGYVDALKIDIPDLKTLLDTGKAIKEAGKPYKHHGQCSAPLDAATDVTQSLNLSPS